MQKFEISKSNIFPLENNCLKKLEVFLGAAIEGIFKPNTKNYLIIPLS